MPDSLLSITWRGMHWNCDSSPMCADDFPSLRITNLYPRSQRSLLAYYLTPSLFDFLRLYRLAQVLRLEHIHLWIPTYCRPEQENSNFDLPPLPAICIPLLSHAGIAVMGCDAYYSIHDGQPLIETAENRVHDSTDCQLSSVIQFSNVPTKTR